MKLLQCVLCSALAFVFGDGVKSSATAAPDPVLPTGVKAVWDLDKAFRQQTHSRERICINGLWKWQPADSNADQVPSDRWGYFKVPGSWPGITDYMQEDTQLVYAHPAWKERNLGGVTAAWYEREISIPSGWAGRRIVLDVPYLNSYAAVYVDDKKAGEMRFPAGELDVTSACPAGSRHRLGLLVVAMPLKAVQMSFSDTSAAKEVRGSVQRRGLCGDVFLASEPQAERIRDVRVDTSVRKGEISLHARLEGLAADGVYRLNAQVTDEGRTVAQFKSPLIRLLDLENGQIVFRGKWPRHKLWDVTTPANQYQLTLSLLANDREVDVCYPSRFGFREFWIEGRDFYLNGTRIHLSAIPLDNAAVSAAAATYEGAKETMLRMKKLGINFVYTHNYGCEPGAHLSFSDILRAADDTGMLVALSQPHFGQYNWGEPDAETRNGYARDAAFYVRVAGSHPSVVMYSTSHNATGYVEGNNPDMIDGVQDPRPDWAKNGVKRALRAEAVIKKLDPSRIVYHHSSGNLGSIYSLNFYTNFTPIQEMDDWFGHWAAKGVKPLFTCEYAVPFTWDWTMYRGWYHGVREFGSASVPWEYCLAEWNAQFEGDRAFQISEAEKTNLRWEARKFREGGGWHRWDFPHPVGAVELDEQFPVIARYLTDNWRAFRTWGMSANSPWQYSDYWRLRPGARRGRKDFHVDWNTLQRPGYSPDYSEHPYETLVTAYKSTDWEPNAAGKALLRNNMPLLAYVAGGPAAFTSKDHNFMAGQTLEKQLIVINDARQTIQGDWSVQFHESRKEGRFTIPAGDQVAIPLRFRLPVTLAPGKYELKATVHFSTGETQSDSFALNVMPAPAPLPATPMMAVFDPKGETFKLLTSMGVTCHGIEANADPSGESILIVGKSALTVDGPGPDVRRVRDGLKVVVFEQTGEVLEKRFGFRIAEYGLRQVFPRLPDHPLLKGLDVESLSDWRGEATILTPRLKYSIGPAYRQTTPVVQWCGLDVPRVWRCGCRGNVASVLIEKPVKGDFLPIVDGGFSLQYSPLLEYREGKGLVLFCQMDLTGRTESDPAADTLVRNIIQYVSAWKPASRREALYAGKSPGRRHLESSGIPVASYEGGKISPSQVLVVGAGGESLVSQNKEALTDFLKTGGHLLVLGLEAAEADTFLPFEIQTKRSEHIAAYFKPPGRSSLLAGIGPADLHNRDPREIPLVTRGASILGNGVLAHRNGTNVVFYQFPPYSVRSKEAGGQGSASRDHEQYNLRRTYRRASFTLARLLANMGVAARTPLLQRFQEPVSTAKREKRWLDAYYLDTPVEWDDPYRFFNW